jgi:hypothetical protein
MTLSPRFSSAVARISPTGPEPTIKTSVGVNVPRSTEEESRIKLRRRALGRAFALSW